MKIHIPDEFGIIVPSDTGVEYTRNGHRWSIEGSYIPIGEMPYNFGWPEWAPEGPNFQEKLQDIPVDTIPQDDRESIPERVIERGYFYDSEELKCWIDSSEKYGWFKLYDELWRFTYGLYDLLDSDPRKRWNDSGELWDQIEAQFSFEYSEYRYHVKKKECIENNEEFDPPLSDAYPKPREGIRWIEITGSKGNKRGTICEWAEEIKGQVVLLICPSDRAHD